jgi:hypothetical protein
MDYRTARPARAPNKGGNQEQLNAMQVQRLMEESPEASASPGWPPADLPPSQILNLEAGIAGFNF